MTRAAGKGKIERFFRTCRQQCLTPLEPQTIPDLDTLNTHFRAWVESEYHLTPHRGLDGETPLDAWIRTADRIRHPDPGIDLETLFLMEVTRKVDKAHTVSLHTCIYEVNPALVGQTVTLRYDPEAPPTRPIQVVHDGTPAGLATPLDLHANTAVKRGAPVLRFGPVDDDQETR